MLSNEALKKMVLPSMKRPGAYQNGIIQIHLTRACDRACFNCTQGSHLAGKPNFITTSQFEDACISLKDYFGVVGIFGGNPALHPEFPTICEILAKHIPFERRGLWCNNPFKHAAIMRKTFNPAVCNLNVHMEINAYTAFKKYWPESRPFGLKEDSRHSPPWVAMQDVITLNCAECNGTGTIWDGTHTCSDCKGTGIIPDSTKIWELISNCDINKHWSAMIGVANNQLQGWFCEIAGAQAILHGESTGIPIPSDPVWWKASLEAFSSQIKKHCFACGIPLRGYGELACSTSGREQVSKTHLPVYQLKRTTREIEVVDSVDQLGNPLELMTDYIGNSCVQ